MLLGLKVQTMKYSAKNKLYLETKLLAIGGEVLWEHYVAGSNPVTPISYISKSQPITNSGK